MKVFLAGLLSVKAELWVLAILISLQRNKLAAKFVFSAEHNNKITCFPDINYCLM